MVLSNKFRGQGRDRSPIDISLAILSFWLRHSSYSTHLKGDRSMSAYPLLPTLEVRSLNACSGSKAEVQKIG
jgi:hypothetical protein